MENKKKIVFLQSHLQFSGGSSSYLLEIAEALNNEFDITIITIRANEAIKKKYSQLNIKEIGGPTTRSIWHWVFFPLHFVRLIYSLRLRTNSIIIANAFPSNWWASLAKIIYSKQTAIWLLHDPSNFIYSKQFIKDLGHPLISPIALFFQPVLKSIDAFLSSKTSMLIANSQFTSLKIQDIYPSSKIQIVEPGINLAKFSFSPDISRTLKLITVGRLVAYKNVLYILDLLANLQKQIANIELTIVGDGEQSKELINYANKHKLPVHFVGEIQNEKLLVDLLQQSAFFISFSENESFGLAPLESMACGTPCILSNSGNFPALINTTKAGILVDKLNHKYIVEWIKTTLENTKELQNMRYAARRRAEEYSWTISAQKLRKILLSFER